MDSQEVITRVTKAFAAVNLQVGEVREVERGGIKMIQIGNTSLDLILGPITTRKLTRDGMRTVDVPGIYLYQRHCDFVPGSPHFSEMSEQIEAKRIEEANLVIRSMVGRLVNDLLIDLLGG
jgi:hypothetical protein